MTRTFAKFAYNERKKNADNCLMSFKKLEFFSKYILTDPYEHIATSNKLY